MRHSPITAVTLVNADVDAIAGLLVLRERQALNVFAPGPILEGLRANPVFNVLDPALVARVEIEPNKTIMCGDGLTVTLLPMPGKIPLYLEDRSAREAR